MIAEVGPILDGKFTRAFPQAHGQWRAWCETTLGRSFDASPRIIAVEIDTEAKTLAALLVDDGKKIDSAYEVVISYEKHPPCWPDSNGAPRGIG